ncbi:MAG: ABC transporter ATP-binding protein [Betaproteobacteria bacterium]|nr:ABC transporter ATP-binding protein [Betaproteobacteria bacterium]
MLLRKLILSESWFKAAAAAAFIQQLLVAGGTFLLGELTTRLPGEGVLWPQALLMLGCMALSGSVAFYVLQLFSLRAERASLKNFFERYFQNTFNQPLFWRSAEERTRRHDMMCREAQEAIQEGNGFFLDIWTTGWNIALNTAAVVLVIGLESGAVILATGIASSLLVHFASQRLSKHAIDEIDDQNQLNGHLSSSWDNLILGNRLSFGLWKNSFNTLFQRASHSAERSLSAREKLLATGSFLTTAAVVASVLVQAWLNQSNITAVIALFAMLPRTLQINMHVQIVHSYWAGWQRLRERLNAAAQCLAPFPEASALELMQPEKIQISEKLNSNPWQTEELIKNIASLHCGRLTIRGANGAGKSVLLSLLKNTLAEKAFYLPAQHELELPGVHSGLSHGEKVIAALNTLAASQSDVQVLLLDEWDANLSPENRRLLSARIETIAQSKVVIEVRHNHETLSLVHSNA